MSDRTSNIEDRRGAIMATSATIDRTVLPNGNTGIPVPVLAPKSMQQIGSGNVSLAISGSLDRQSLTAIATLLKMAAPSSLLRPVTNVAIEHLPIQFPLQNLAQIGYILPLGSVFRTAQGQSFAVSVQFTLAGPATTLYLTYSGLPAGVTPTTTSVSYTSNSTRRIFLTFNVARDAQLVSNKSIVIQYAGFAGSVKAEIPLMLSVWAGFDMQHQLESEWCWAATAASINRHYDPATTVTQCQIVNHQLNRTDACGQSIPQACNQPGFLDEALGFLDCLDHTEASPVPYATVVAQASLSRPLGVRVAWAGGGAHFLAATGYEQNQMMVLEDPIYGTSVATYGSMMSCYQGCGTWTNSYFTRP